MTGRAKQIIEREYSIEELKSKIIPQEKLNEERSEIKEAFIFEDASTPILKGEFWKQHPEQGWGKYQVSDLGRVMHNGKIVPQKNKDGKTGWLVLDKDNFDGNIAKDVYIYTMVAETFLGKKIGDNLDVHHITNDGYNNRPENLILLTKEQHSAVHGFEIK